MLPDLATLRPNTGVTRALQYATAIFTLTVLIGLANATKVIGALSRDTVLAHVHSGTLGFITLAVFGIALWIYGSGTSDASKRNVLITALATLAYIVAFWSGNLPARAAFGALQLLVIVAWWWWVFTRVQAVGFNSLDIPRLSVFFGLTTLIVGSTLGVIVQVLLATGQTVPTSPDLIGGHATAQVSGYLVLTAVGIGEWRLRPDRGARSRGGLTVAYMLFAAGLITALSVLTGVIPLALAANLLQLAAVIVFFVRTFSALLSTDWMAGPARHFALVGPFLIVNVVLFFVLITLFMQAQGDFSKVPFGVVAAYDHSMFIGVMTNVLFGTAFAIAAAQRQWAWADGWVFWLMNLGLIAFLAVLVFAGYDSELVRYSAPIMGVGVLLAILALSIRLNAAASEAAPMAAPMRA